MNCSGKHAAMLATCVVNDWPTESYRDPGHPLQEAIRVTLEDLTGHEVETVAVDGCGAPLFDTTLQGLATSFQRLAVATDGAEHRVAEAVRAHPEWVSGTRRDEAALLKVDDGAPRARPVLMAAILKKVGIADLDGVDAAAVERTGEHVLLGGGRPIGQLRALV
jgi:L-asparaginase II